MKKRIIGLFLALAGLVGLGIAASAPANATGTPWTTCASKQLAGTNRPTVFCNTWVTSTDAYGHTVVALTGCEVRNVSAYNIVVGNMSSGYQRPGATVPVNIGDSNPYTVLAGYTVSKSEGAAGCYAPSWLADWDGPTGTAYTAWANYSAAKVGNHYESATNYDTI